MFRKQAAETIERKDTTVIEAPAERPTLPSEGADAAQAVARQPDAAPPAAPQSATRTETVSCIGSGMTVHGNVECNGPAHIFGRVEGELRAPDLVIGEVGQVEGSIVAQDVTVCGSVKGTIRAVRVKLQGGSMVEGDIFHRSLSIDEGAVFEGSSRRVENPTETALPAKARPPQAEAKPAPAEVKSPPNGVKPPAKKSAPSPTLPRASVLPSIED